MNIFAADRPHSPSGPMYCDTEGNAIAVIQGLHLQPLPDGAFVIGGLFCVAPNSARWFSTIVANFTALQNLLSQYVDNPEQTMVDVFGWVFEQNFKPKLYSVPGPAADLNLFEED